MGCNFGASPSFTAMVFSYPETSSSSKSLCSSRKKRQPKFIAAARGKSSQNHDFLWVSEVTLGIFGVRFEGFSVLHCHGVFPSGDQQQQQKPPQQQEEKVVKIHSSSKRKKQPKSSFLWVSEVTLGIFGVQFWGFSVLHCLAVFPSGDQQQHFLWVSEVTLGIFGVQFWGFSVLHCYSGFSIRGLSFEQQQEEIVAKITCFFLLYY